MGDLRYCQLALVGVRIRAGDSPTRTAHTPPTPPVMNDLTDSAADTRVSSGAEASVLCNEAFRQCKDEREQSYHRSWLKRSDDGRLAFSGASG